MKKKKKGSALIFVVILISVIFTLSVGIMQITLASLRQSTSYYGKNEAFYLADSSMDKIFFYLDKFADKARNEANNYCFDESSSPNLEKGEIRDLYNSYMEGNITKEGYENKIKDIFIREYKKSLIDFLEGNSEMDIEITEDNINLSNKYWGNWKEHILNTLNNEEVEVDFKTYKEAKEDETYKKFLDGIDEHKLINYDKDDYLHYPKDTIILKVYLPKKNIKRYMISTFEFNPFGKELNKVSLNQKKIKKGYNKVLDYGVVVGKNLFVINGEGNFILNGNAYVRGTGNELNAQKSYEEFGGIIVGVNDNTISQLNKATKNKTSVVELEKVKGNLNVNGNVYLGDLEEVETSGEGSYYKLNSGFLRTSNEYSNVTISGKLYCHSIVTDDKAKNSNIIVNDDAYIADNVSLYAPNSNITVNKNLISFEQADDDTNFNSSSSVVVNDDSARLTVGENIVLFGTGYVEDLKDALDSNKFYKTIETASINPNFLIYNYKIDEFSVPSGEKLNWKTELNDYKDYSLEQGNSIKMYNMTTGTPTEKAEKGLNFLFQYLVRHKNSDFYEQTYNTGNNIIVRNMKFEDNSVNTSYFPYVFLANGKIQIFRNLDFIQDKDKIYSLIASDIYKAQTEGAQAIYTKVSQEIVTTIKNEVIDKLSFKDKGIDNSTCFEDYIDFDNLNELEIKDTDRKVLIIITQGNLELDLKDYDGYKVLVVTKGILTVKNTSENKVNVSGNLIAKEDLVVKEGDIELNTSSDISKDLLNYYKMSQYDDCMNLYKLFAKGVIPNEIKEQDVYSGFEERVKTNIDIKFKRQILTR